MKYIMFNVKVGEIERKVPIIFPSFMIHGDVAAVIKKIFTYQNQLAEVISAGDVYIDCKGVGGESTTLNLESNSDDLLVINNYDYLHGL